MRWELIEGVANVRAHSAAWDRLWERSDAASPTARCEAVCRWHEQFQPGSPLRVVAVRDGNEFLAVLPLASRRWLGFATLPTNDWVAGGTLLFDPAADPARLAASLLEGFARLPLCGGVLRGVPVDRPPWQAVIAAAQRLGWRQHLQPLHAVGTIDLQSSWDDTEKRLGGNYRRQLAKAQRRLEAAGRLEFSILDHFPAAPDSPGGQRRPAGPDGSADQLDSNGRSPPDGPSLASALREGFELEARGWKGAGGTAITQQPGLLAFVTRHAASLIGNPERPSTSGVRLATLRLDGHLIAFLYCWWGKDHIFTPKIAYDERHAECSPGKLVFCWNLRDLLREGRWRQLDMAGPLADYNAKWATGSYNLATLVLGKPGLAGRLLVAAFSVRHRWRQWRRS